MPHHSDEKGRIAPAQSKTALRMRTMGQISEQTPYSGEKHGKHAYGQTHVGIGGMARMAHLKEVNKDKRAKSRVVLRGQKNVYRKEYTKVGARMHKKGLLQVPKS